MCVYVLTNAFILFSPLKNFVDNNPVFFAVKPHGFTVFAQHAFCIIIFDCFSFIIDAAGFFKCFVKSGTTVEFYVKKETTIQISLKGYFGHPSIVVKPGDKIQASISGMGSVSLAKVSMLTGNANTHGW